MGGAASVKSEAEVRTLDSEQLAQYALENKIANYVAETIETNEIDGDIVYDLDEATIDELAGNRLQKKKLLSAVHKLPRDIDRMANSAEELESEARELFTRYDVNGDYFLDQHEFGILLTNEIGIPLTILV